MNIQKKSRVHWPEKKVAIQPFELKEFKRAGVEVHILREDLIDAEISGNKWRKLKYNLLKAAQLKHQVILTFGGAYSNHIAAVAAAGKRFNFRTIGVIRGDEVNNPTLEKARKDGMQLHFVSRSDYRLKGTEEFKEYLIEEFGSFFLVPEGGGNYLGLNGCMEILNNSMMKYDAVVAACGTGTMLAGLILSASSCTHIYGVSALKGGFIRDEVNKHLTNFLMSESAVNDYQDCFTIWNDAHRGGYAKTDKELVAFIKRVKLETNVPLDAIYNGKTVMKLSEQASQGAFKANSKILVVHSGGVQGNSGMNERLGLDLPTH